MLKDLRKAKKLTQNDVAKSLKVNCSTVTKWETGINTPKLTYISKLAKLYGCTESEILRCITKKKK